MVKNNNHQPLTKKDLWGALTDFFEQVIVPYVNPKFEEIEKRLDDHDKRFDKIDNTLERMEDRLDCHGKQLDNHEVRLVKLETPLA